MTKLLIGCAIYRVIERATGASMLRAAQGLTLDGVDDVIVATQAGYSAPRNVELLAENAIELGCDWLLYHDADIEYAPGHIARILKTWREVSARHDGKAVVGALYPSSSGLQTLIGKLDASDPVWGAWRPGLVGQAEHLGFGFVLIPTRIFAELQKPWFEDVWNGKDLVTPDVRFSQRARELGYTLYLDTGLDVNHWVNMPLNYIDAIQAQGGLS